jgi:predicted DNA-binding transcriptional regulator AlpA
MDLLTQPETAEETRLSGRILERHRLAGTGPKFVRLGRRVLYRREDVEEWIAANICGSTSKVDAMGGPGCCGKIQAENSGDLDHPIEEISAGMSRQHQKADHPYRPPPLAGKATPIDFDQHRARNKKPGFSSAREGRSRSRHGVSWDQRR